MPVYDYSGTAFDGSIASGSAKASDTDDLRLLLLDKGVLLSSALPRQRLSEKSTPKSQVVSAGNLKLLAAGTRQLATMLKAGMPLDTALQTLARQTSSSNFRSIMKEVSEKVRAGPAHSSIVSRRKHAKSYTKCSESLHVRRDTKNAGV
jgi:general secretion pathway protein F